MRKSMQRVQQQVQAEYKSLPIHTKAIDGRTVTTLFSVFGNIDAYSDRIWPGAFTNTIAQRGGKVLHLWQHDFESPPIAVVKSLREVTRDELPPDIQQQYPEATGGAEATSEFLDTPRASEVLAALTAGSPLEASFGYDPIKIDFTTEGEQKIRNLREVRLWELSTVLWGANPATLGSKALVPTTKDVAAKLHQIKQLEGMDLWDAIDECYDLYGGASAFGSVAYLLMGECDDAAGAAPLISALRMLLAFLAGELDEIEQMIAAGEASGIQMAALPGLALQMKALVKAGARHSDADMQLINQMHRAVVDLGCTNCKGSLDDDPAVDDKRAPVERRAEAPVSLTLQKARLFLLDYT